MYRSANSTLVSRSKKKLTEKTTWYRKRPKKVDGEGMESDQRDGKKKRKRKPKDNEKKIHRRWMENIQKGGRTRSKL